MTQMHPDTGNEIQLNELWLQNTIILSRNMLEWRRGSAGLSLVVARVVLLGEPQRG